MAKKYYWLLAVFVVVYIATILIFRSDSASLVHYHINDVQLKALSLTIVIPAIAIWFAAIYSIVNIRKYADKIKNTPDGKGFKELTLGLTILGLSLPITSLISRLLTYGSQQKMTSQSVATIINTHLSIAFYLFAFFFLCKGSLTLLRSVNGTRLSDRQHSIVSLALSIISVPYIVATLSNPSRAVAVAPATTATYYMPDWLIVTTIDLPYIVIWALGFYATMLLQTYHHRVGGNIYRASLSRLNRGFFTVIVATVLVQFITAATTSISGWGLGAILLLVYALLAVIAAGFVLIALGAKGLAKLEDVI